MARGSAFRTNSIIEVDVDELVQLANDFGLPRKTIQKAWGVALRKAAVSLRRRALNEFKSAAAPRGMKMVGRRVMPPFIFRNSGFGLDEMKLWFGLNRVKIKDLKGRITGKEKPRHAKRDPSTGRFVAADGENGNGGKGGVLTFKSAGELGSLKYENAWRSPDRRNIYQRDANGRITAVDVPLYDALHVRIEDNVVTEASTLVYKYFTHELQFRLRSGMWKADK